MAKWLVEQMVEVSYRTVVEAATEEEAIKMANESSDWERTEFMEWEDDYWLENLDTEQQFTRLHGNWMEE